MYGLTVCVYVCDLVVVLVDDVVVLTALSSHSLQLGFDGEHVLFRKKKNDD